MQFRINFRSGKPVYLQVVDQVKTAAASGGLKSGEPLPAIRPLAEELRVNRNTIAKAYAELERQGIVETVAGKGCFARGAATPYRKDVRVKLLTTEIDQAVTEAHHLQVSRTDFLRLAAERFDRFEAARDRAANE